MPVDSNRPTAKGGKKGFAKGSALHIGGSFIRDGKTSFMGSLGCFGVGSGSSDINKFYNDVKNRRAKNRDKTINITVQKRSDVQWKFYVDSKGNKTSKGF